MLSGGSQFLGSGKTLAFVLPVVHALGQASAEGIRACILAPTRELAQQVKLQAGTGIAK